MNLEDTHGSIVHVLFRDGEDSREREDHTNEQGPEYASPVKGLSEETIPQTERPRFEHDLWVIMEHTTQKDWNDVARVQGYGTKREDGVGSNWTGKVEKARKDTDEGAQPDGAQGRRGYIGYMSKVTTIRKAWM